MGIKLAYGIREGRVVHISELQQSETGEGCRCKCPECGGILVARLGNKNQWHFAHKTVDCDITHAQETGLHKMAKEIIRENNSILVPGLAIAWDEIVPNNVDRYAAAEVKIDLPNIEAVQVNYDSVEIEKTIRDIIADAVIKIKGKPRIVEIAVTHFVDETKEKKLAEIGLDTFEIDLSELLKSAPTRSEITRAVLSDVTNRKWIINQKKDQLLIKKKQEFGKKYDIAVLKREQDKKLEQEKRKKKVREIRKLMIPENYASELRQLRDDEQAYYWFNKFSFSKGLSQYPFFMDIPITGEFVFTCDRRIWQGKLFNDYVYRGGIGGEYELIPIDHIQERILNKKMIVQYDQMIVRYDPEKAYFIKGQERELSFSYDVIRRYFEYLDLLGFVFKHSPDLWWYATSKTINPPNRHAADILKKILKSVDDLSPNINQIIKRQLLSSKLNKSEKDDIKEWF